MSTDNNRPGISVIVQLYNAESFIETLYTEITESLNHNGNYELILIDDGSNDKTPVLLREIAARDSHVCFIKMRSSFGEASCLDAGLKNSSGERIGFISGRIQINVKQLSNLLKVLGSDKEFVVGRRHPRRDSILNRFISWFFNQMVQRITKIKLHDVNSGVFATYRYVLEKIAFYGDLFYFLPVLAAQQGYRVGEEKIEQMPGTFRVSRYPKEYLQRMLDMITVIFLTRYTKKPIHFMGLLGTVFFITGLGIEIYLFFYRILQMGPIAGRPLLILGALLLVIGIQIISIGLLGEMIIFTHAGEIEEYNIEEVING